MNQIEQEIRRSLGAEYDHTKKPSVYFFDNAVKVSTDEEDRPRFKNAVYISKKSTTSNGTQDFHRKIIDSDKAEFPAEWEHYLKVKDNLKKPRIALLPGMDEATKHEMQAIGIYSLEDLVSQDEFNEWKDLARRILDATDNTIRDSRRETLQDNENQQPERILETSCGGHRGSIRTSGYAEETQKDSKEKDQEKGYQENQPQEVTFDFSMGM